MDDKAKKQNFPIWKYESSSRLGIGAYGTVQLYLIKKQHNLRTDLPQKVAVKVITSVKANAFDHELNHLAKLEHPHLVKFFGHCRIEDENLYGPGTKKAIILKYYEKDLLKFRMERTTFSLEETRSILFQIALALKYLWSENIVHRDVKPDNILININEPNDIHAALTDLGISRRMPKAEPCSMTSTGTPSWMAPEVHEAKPRYGHSSDVFSFGLTSFFTFFGKLPMDGTSNKGKNIPYYVV